ncbi:U6 snRNA phosphodiesterase 1 [Battus philenor]|uniref:U6 snRNA phosphodiesterase 1 n=1 Tax=Battus philenor TaxID=42288 RepID=UPI0035CF1F74
MSGLLYICNYGSESDSDDCEVDNVPEVKKTKLPTPDLSHIPVPVTDQHFDVPELHNGRIRSFPHVRGNWATFVYIKYPEEESLLKLANKLKNLLSNNHILSHLCDDFHLSLSKTVVLNYHTIIPFTQSLKKALIVCERFYLGLDNIEVFCNEQKTRTFISIQVNYFSKRSLLALVHKVDEVLGEFKLEKFYHDPSFHISLLWIEGDQRTLLESYIENLNNIVSKEVGKTIESVFIDTVNCKSGNKFFQYQLE